MASEEERERHSLRRRKAYLKKKEVGERRGAFSIKERDLRVPEYKRERLDPRNIEEYINE